MREAAGAAGKCCSCQEPGDKYDSQPHAIEHAEVVECSSQDYSGDKIGEN